MKPKNPTIDLQQPDGISLRDVFAGIALHQLLQSDKNRLCVMVHDRMDSTGVGGIAEAAYVMADAMINVRNL